MEHYNLMVILMREFENPEVSHEIIIMFGKLGLKYRKATTVLFTLRLI